jgi:hypothetical protein
VAHTSDVCLSESSEPDKKKNGNRKVKKWKKNRSDMDYKKEIDDDNEI